MSLDVILIVAALIIGVAYFSVRNARKQKEKKSTRRR